MKKQKKLYFDLCIGVRKMVARHILIIQRILPTEICVSVGIFNCTVKK